MIIKRKKKIKAIDKFKKETSSNEEDIKCTWLIYRELDLELCQLRPSIIKVQLKRFYLLTKKPM
jgi:hypothetical protein